MPAPKGQKLIIVDINANTQTFIESKLAVGYVIEHIVSLTPTFAKLLIVYAEPPDPAP